MQSIKTFKDIFKYFKSKTISPNFSTVYSFENDFDSNKIQKVYTQIGPNENYHDPILFGFKKFSDWKIYEVKEKPGLILIRNPFTNLGQRYWIARCLKDFSCKPNKLNIDAHNYLTNSENWWDVCCNDLIRGPSLKEKLRWATLGYHHNWDTKVYSETSKDPFPNDLFEMTRVVAAALGYDNYSAQAAIVNFYHMNSNLSPHTDHSEENLDAPLFSFSFGQSAVFLIGGKTKEETPIALFVHSGDILIMSQESRQCYHAIPCIIKSPTTPWTPIENDNFYTHDIMNQDTLKLCYNNDLWKHFEDYVETSRINLNVRQVLLPNKHSLNN